MSTNDTTIEEQPEEVDPIAEAILNGGQRHTDDHVESGADAAVEQVAADQPDELILGKFKTPDDLIEAYKNLESHNTQTAQRLSELEALLQEDEEEPAPAAWGATFNGDPQNEEQLIGWAERDPGAAAQWAIANSNRIPEETVNGLWEHWFERKPTEANAWFVQQQTQQIRQEYEAELEALREQVAPLRDAQTQGMFENALGSLEQQIPDLVDYSAKIQEYVDNIPVDQLHLAFFPNGMDTPEKIQEGVKSLYAIVRMQEAQFSPRQDQQQQVSAFTQSRQGVVDMGPEDYAAKINDAILNAR